MVKFLFFQNRSHYFSIFRKAYQENLIFLVFSDRFVALFKILKIQIFFEFHMKIFMSFEQYSNKFDYATAATYILK